MTIILRQCTRCKEYLTLYHFYNTSEASQNKYGKSSRCKKCERERRQEYYKNNPKAQKQDQQQGRRNHLKQKYGITEKQYNELLEKQGFLCAICDGEYIGKKLYVDHDHKTGKIRGLLCFACNRGLGSFEDNPKLLQAAIEYLNKVRSPIS